MSQLSSFLRNLHLYSTLPKSRNFCPYCSSNTPMLPYEHPLTGNRKFYGQCSRCQCRWRTRFLYFLIQMEILSRRDEISVLHTAPEYAVWKLLSQQKNIHYTAIDINPKIYPPETACQYQDLMNLSLKKHHYDFLISSHVLEHVEDDFQVLRQWRRVLKEDGTVLLCLPVSRREKTVDERDLKKSVPLSEAERLQLFGQEDHLRLYGQDVVQRLEMGGFSVRQIVPEKMFPRQVLLQMGDMGLVPDNNPLQLDTNCFFILTPRRNSDWYPTPHYINRLPGQVHPHFGWRAISKSPVPSSWSKSRHFHLHARS
ncbi:MAG: methyltransferase domain-containing protein [Planctomycetia bacterium]|nr:methyltransferase domain-containing protein [Planctomycetia bacterium]